MNEINKLTERIIGLAIKIHRVLGPGFVEKIYQRALYLEFKNNQLRFEREKKISVYYSKALLGYEKVDFIVNNMVIVEIKCVAEISDIHKAQALSYIKAANVLIGLIINFAKPKIEVKRLINSALHSNSASQRLQGKYTGINSALHSNSASQRLQGKYTGSVAVSNKKTATTETQNKGETRK